MTTATKSVAAATAASLVGLGVTVFWPVAGQVPQVRVDGAAIIERSTNLLNWQRCATNVFVCTNAAEMFRGVASYQLAWDGSPLNPENVTYTVYCNGLSTNVGTNLTAVIACQGQTNTFTVTASDPYGVESDPSDALVLPAVKPVLIITKL
jgi:hypothetical protein